MQRINCKEGDAKDKPLHILGSAAGRCDSRNLQPMAQKVSQHTHVERQQ